MMKLLRILCLLSTMINTNHSTSIACNLSTTANAQQSPLCNKSQCAVKEQIQFNQHGDPALLYEVEDIYD